VQLIMGVAQGGMCSTNEAVIYSRYDNLRDLKEIETWAQFAKRCAINP